MLRELASTRDHAIVLVEHNLDAAVDIVDRVVVLDAEGRLAFDGPVREVLRDHVEELLGLGVWLPVSTLAAMRLRAAGVALDPLPLTPAELAAAIRVRGLSVRRGGRRGPVVVHDVDLDVAAGEFLAVVGTNGAGKTSLLQAVAGVIPAASGTVDVLGLDPQRADSRERSRRIGFVFQNPEHQFVATTVEDELETSLRVQEVPEPERAGEVARMLERFGLGELRGQHPFMLSGGQKRRLSVGTALIAGAPVIALDEPTFGQDRERAAELLDVLRALHEEGTTVLVVTHDLQLVADYATRVAVMADGRLLGSGPTAEVLAGPLIDEAGLRHPPLARATRGLARHPEWHAVTRMSQLPSRRPGSSGGAA